MTSALRVILVALVVGVVLAVPDRIVAGGSGGPWFALEALVLIGGVALAAPLARSRIGAFGVSFVVVGVLALALGDGAARMSHGRALDLPADLALLQAVGDLLTGSIGKGATWGVALVGLMALAGLLLMGTWVIRRLHHGSDPRGDAPASSTGSSPAPSTGLSTDGSGGRWNGARWSGIGLLTAALVLGGMMAAGSSPTALERSGGGALGYGVMEALDRRVVAPSVRIAWAHLGPGGPTGSEVSVDELTAPATHADVDGLLSGLGGRDVILAFIESYGVSALEDDRYAPLILPRLDEMAERLDAAGLFVMSATLEAPIHGGRSWLAHATVLTGLRIDSEPLYETFLEGDRETLVHDFSRAGYRTAALVPALIRDWPEGDRLGWDRIRTAATMGYEGPSLHWATMPDQFVWWRLEEGERRDPDPRPLFAMLAPVSSHAPWTPILPVLDDWEGLADGTVFEAWADAGLSPGELWRDFDRVREHFALSIEYALEVMIQWAERYMDDRTFLVVMGDHQPSPVITGHPASPDVPVHVIATDPDLLAPLAELGFVPGTRPDPGPGGAAHGMEVFRSWLIETYSGDAP